ncbi:hypothetical protein SKUN_001612 [Spiroplasma kunkelii CR2-3x]|uniref:Uncharacterized protein n=2 Tax=Spiroplasma kunkelii TaxID=47834 RepID=A0A0K2JIP4_SPIKU|nr:hypothetical protein SKUN_001612 [Spiroplasma kunkelii CR2-3x]
MNNMRFVICYKNSDIWRPVKDDNNDFIIEKILRNSKTELELAKLKCNLKIIDKWYYFVEKYKTKQIEPILDKND